MKKVLVKYNPYSLATEVTVNGEKVATFGKIAEMCSADMRLQEWIEEIPELLDEECNDKYELTFHGTILDFEDLVEVFEQSEHGKLLQGDIKRIPAKETSDKEELIEEVFNEIQKGPFEELKDAEIKNAFNHAKSSDFEVCVVATMSAGKSTLINSMLGNNLMPSKQEACTAIITKLKDVDNNKNWYAEVYNKDNKIISTHKSLTYETMSKLNSDENVSIIKACGNIPFVTSEDVSLVLIDTPGPNNSRDSEHKRIQSEFLNKSSKSLVLYIMEGTFGSDDDNNLLQRVAESMKVGGKQSKDRFIFVVNKMDGRRPEDGDIEHTLDRIRTYLKGHGIENPQLFPAAALPALNFRLALGDAALDEQTVDDTEYFARKLNRDTGLHLENYASIPMRVKNDIDHRLDKAKQNKDALTEALIHTGVVSVEAAIRQYVQKYAKTAKIKNIVETFMHKIEELDCIEKTKQELVRNTKERDNIVKQIKNIREKVDDAKAAKTFQASVDVAVNEVRKNIPKVIDKISQKYQSKVSMKIKGLEGKEIEVGSIQSEINSLKRFATDMEPAFQTEMNQLINESLVETLDVLFKNYSKKLQSLTSEINLTSSPNIIIDPLKLMSGSFALSSNVTMDKLKITTREVEDGQEYVRNRSKAWYKPWTWFDDDGYYRTKYKTVKYVKVNDLAQEYFAPLKKNVMINGQLAQQHANEQSEKIVATFKNEFKKLDDVLKQKLKELETCADDKDMTEKRIKEMKERILWLENIHNKVVSILEI